MKYLLDGDELADAIQCGAIEASLILPSYMQEFPSMLREVADEIRNRYTPVLHLPLQASDDILELDIIIDAEDNAILMVNPTCDYPWAKEQEGDLAKEVARQLNAYPLLIDGLRRMERGYRSLYEGRCMRELLESVGEKV